MFNIFSTLPIISPPCLWIFKINYTKYGKMMSNCPNFNAPATADHSHYHPMHIHWKQHNVFIEHIKIPIKRPFKLSTVLRIPAACRPTSLKWVQSIIFSSPMLNKETCLQLSILFSLKLIECENKLLVHYVQAE